MKKLFFIITSITLVTTLSSCDKILLTPKVNNDPVSNFEELWQSFDQMYGGFETKKINWDSLYQVYRPTVSEFSSDEDLYLTITSMLDALNDSHVFLFPTNPDLQGYTSGILGKLKTYSDFKLSVVKANYLTEKLTSGESMTYGLLENNLGYIHFGHFNENEKQYRESLEKMITHFENTNGLIIDIRGNEGGTDQNAVYVAGHFAKERKAVFKFRLRNGVNHSDFTPFSEYFVQPEGKTQYNKSIVVLTNRFTISAAETFALSMRRHDEVTIIGDTTTGAFSDVIRKELPNGWAYGISVGDWRNFEGKSFEGIGLPPDILIQNEATEILNGIDAALNTAISTLQ